MTWVNAALAAYSAYNGGSYGGGGGGGGGTSAIAPSSAVAGAYGSGLDSSGWVVNFSGTTSASYAKQEAPTTPAASSAPSLSFVPIGSDGLAAAPALQAGGWTTWAMLGLLGLALWRLKRSKH